MRLREIRRPLEKYPFVSDRIGKRAPSGYLIPETQDRSVDTASNDYVDAELNTPHARARLDHIDRRDALNPEPHGVGRIGH